jgi:hypothetical protein
MSPSLSQQQQQQQQQVRAAFTMMNTARTYYDEFMINCAKYDC